MTEKSDMFKRQKGENLANLTVLASLVLIITKGTVEGSELSKLVSLDAHSDLRGWMLPIEILVTADDPK